MQPSSNPTPESQVSGAVPEVPAIVPELPQSVPSQPPASAPLSTQAVPDTQLPTVPAAAPIDPAAADPAAAAQGSGPAIAADVDVIEKEWVDRAEGVIAKTAGDPHAEEEAVENLQVDYMKKRYNKDVKQSDG